MLFLQINTLQNSYYFVDGYSLNDRPRLAQVVSKKLSSLLVDPPSEEYILDFLNGSEGRREILMALQALNQLGVHSIPKFIVEGRTVVDGAAHSDTFVHIFRKIEAKGKIHGGPIFGDILGIPPQVIENGSHYSVKEK